MAAERPDGTVSVAAYAKFAELDKGLLELLIETDYIESAGRVGGHYLLSREQTITEHQLIATARFAYEEAVESYGQIAMKMQGILTHAIEETAEILNSGLAPVGAPGNHMEALSGGRRDDARTFDQLRTDLNLAWMQLGILQRHLASIDQVARVLGGRR